MNEWMNERNRPKTIPRPLPGRGSNTDVNIIITIVVYMYIFHFDFHDKLAQLADVATVSRLRSWSCDWTLTNIPNVLYPAQTQSRGVSTLEDTK